MRINLFAITFLALAVSQCGVEKPTKAEPDRGSALFFPALPNTPRFQYVTTLNSSKDVEPEPGKLLSFVAGEEQEKKVRVLGKIYGVATHNGCVYVCDLSVGAIAVMDMKHKMFRYMGLNGPGRLNKPINLAIDRDGGQIFVADMGRSQILVFDTDGRFRRAFGEKEQFSPSDVAINDKNVFVCDVRGHQIHVLDRHSGRSLHRFGKPGSQDGQLFHPTNIALQGDRLFVSDTNNFRVQAFDLTGRFLFSVGELGDRPGNFSRNKGISVDRDGLMYVVDAAFENVQVFNKDRELLMYFLQPGQGKSDINLPADIWIDYDHLAYFKDYFHPKFQAKYLLFVTSQYGLNKVNVYAHGIYQP